MTPSFRGLIGAARADITPPPGIHARSWGAARHDVAEGVHRPLTLTGLAIRGPASSPPLILLAADLGWWKGREEEEFVRGGVRSAPGLGDACCLFCLSHTHAGPSLGRDDADRPGGALIEAYLGRLRDAAIGVAHRALAAAVPATLTWRHGRCDLAANRDLPDPAGGRVLVGFNPGGAADDTLLVGRVAAPSGRILATIVNYACHPTTLGWTNRLLSPDYPGAMREVVEGATGAPCLFLQGASGELAPAAQYSGDVALADAHGRRLGHAVLSTLAGLPLGPGRLTLRGVVESGAPLAFWEHEPQPAPEVLAVDSRLVQLELKPGPGLTEIEVALAEAPEGLGRERLRRQRAVLRNVGGGAAATTVLHGWRLGDALLFAHPHEAYSAFQLEVRRHFTPRPVVAVNLANGYASYLPPWGTAGLAGLYAAGVSPFAAGGLERLTAAAIGLGAGLLRVGEPGGGGEGRT